MKYILLYLLLFPSILLAQIFLKGVVANSKKDSLPLTNIFLLNKSVRNIINDEGQLNLTSVSVNDSKNHQHRR